jgi:hypothetical protein
LQAASPLGALASSTVGTGNTSAAYKPKEPCSLPVANRWTINAVSTVGWWSLATVGSCRYVPGWPIETKESSEYEYVPPRFAIAKKFESAMVFVGVALVTASPRGAATLVLSRRSAEKLSWRRETSSEGVHQALFYPFL